MNVDKWSGTLIHLLRGLAWAKGNKILYCAQDLVIISNCSRIRNFCTLPYNSLAILALVMGGCNRVAVAVNLWGREVQRIMLRTGVAHSPGI